MQLAMDYKSLYPWAPPNFLTKTSSNTSHEKIVTLRKSKCHFGKEDDWIFLDPCEVDDLCVVLNPYPLTDPFATSTPLFLKESFFISPYLFFEKELLTELNVAPAQLHPNNWAFV